MAPITDDENAAHRKEREALRVLLISAGWTYLLGRIAAVRQERIDGLAEIGAPQEKSRQHVYGYHDANDLPGWPERRMAELDALIQQHTEGK